MNRKNSYSVVQPVTDNIVLVLVDLSSSNRVIIHKMVSHVSSFGFKSHDAVLLAAWHASSSVKNQDMFNIKTHIKANIILHFKHFSNAIYVVINILKIMQLHNVRFICKCKLSYFRGGILLYCQPCGVELNSPTVVYDHLYSRAHCQNTICCTEMYIVGEGSAQGKLKHTQTTHTHTHTHIE